MSDTSYLEHIYLFNDKCLYFRVFDHVAVIFDNGKWTEVPYDDDIMFDLPKLSIEAAKDRLGECDNPDEICKQIVKDRWDAFISQLKEKIAHPKRKVIGWVQYGYIWEHGIKQVDNDDDDWYYAGLIRDIKDNGYFLSGAQYQDLNIEPVFDDYTYMPLSRRGFADVIARSKDMYHPMDYSHYTEYDFIDDKDVKVPLAGKYDDRPLPLITLPNDIFDELYIHIYDFYHDYTEDATNLPDSDLAIYLLGVNKSDEHTYFPGDELEIINSDESNSERYLITIVRPISSLDDLDQFIKDDEDVHLFKYHRDQIQELLSKGEVLLLGLKQTYWNGD